jgi:hypothetical protein
MSQSH